MTEELQKLSDFVGQPDFDALTFLVLLEECCDKVREKPRGTLLQYYRGLSDLILKLDGDNDELVWGLPNVLLREVRETCISNNEIMDAIRHCLLQASSLGANDVKLLFSTEILKKCKASEVDIYAEERCDDEDGNNPVLRVFQTKVELLLSLYIIPASKGTNKTSRILATVVSALMQLLVNNLSQEDYDLAGTLLDIVIFFYNHYELPDNGNDPNSDERYTMDKILRSFWTYSINLCLKEQPCFAEAHQLSKIRRFEDLKDRESIDNSYIMRCKKIINITQEKLNIDLVKEFHACIEETKNIYINLPRKTYDKITNELTEEVYQMSYIHDLTMMETRQTKLLMDSVGTLALTSIYYIANDELPAVSFEISDVILLYIRFTSASLYSASFHNTYIEGLCRFYLWNCIINHSHSILLLKENIELVPGYMLKIFLQLLLLKTCNERTNSQKRMNFSLISHILAFCKDSLAFEFISDTLLSCPYLEAKIAVAGLLKDLMSKNISQFKLTIEQPEECTSINTPPPLPDRPPIPVDEHRIASIHTLTKMCIKEISGDTNNKTQGNLILLQYFMNLLVTLHKQWDVVLLREIKEDVEKQFNNRLDQEFPEIEFLRITNATLAQYL